MIYIATKGQSNIKTEMRDNDQEDVNLYCYNLVPT